jgi:hypothetical protein
MQAPRDASQDVYELHRSLAKWQARAQRAEQELTRVSKAEEVQKAAAGRHHSSPLKHKSPIARALFPGGSPGKKGGSLSGDGSPGEKLTGIPESLAGELDSWQERALSAEKEVESLKREVQNAVGELESARGELKKGEVDPPWKERAGVLEIETLELKGKVRRMRDDAEQMREEIAILRSTLEMQTQTQNQTQGLKELQAEADVLKAALYAEREQHRREKLEWRETSNRLKTLLAFWPEEVSDGVNSGQRAPSGNGENSAQGSNGGLGFASPIHVAASGALEKAGADVRESSESSNREFEGFSPGPVESPEQFEMDNEVANPLSPRAPLDSPRRGLRQTEEVKQTREFAKATEMLGASPITKLVAKPRSGSLLVRRTGSPIKGLSVVITKGESLPKVNPGGEVPRETSPSRSVSPAPGSLSPGAKLQANRNRGFSSPLAIHPLAIGATWKAAQSPSDNSGSR